MTENSQQDSQQFRPEAIPVYKLEIGMLIKASYRSHDGKDTVVEGRVTNFSPNGASIAIADLDQGIVVNVGNSFVRSRNSLLQLESSHPEWKSFDISEIRDFLSESQYRQKQYQALLAMEGAYERRLVHGKISVEIVTNRILLKCTDVQGHVSHIDPATQELESIVLTDTGTAIESASESDSSALESYQERTEVAETILVGMFDGTSMYDNPKFYDYLSNLASADPKAFTTLLIKWYQKDVVEKIINGSHQAELPSTLISLLGHPGIAYRLSQEPLDSTFISAIKSLGQISSPLEAINQLKTYFAEKTIYRLIVFSPEEAEAIAHLNNVVLQPPTVRNYSDSAVIQQLAQWLNPEQVIFANAFFIEDEEGPKKISLIESPRAEFGDRLEYHTAADARIMQSVALDPAIAASVGWHSHKDTQNAVPILFESIQNELDLLSRHWYYQYYMEDFKPADRSLLIGDRKIPSTVTDNADLIEMFVATSIRTTKTTVLNPETIAKYSFIKN